MQKLIAFMDLQVCKDRDHPGLSIIPGGVINIVFKQIPYPFYTK